MNAYVDREQTEAKHFILRRYLQELAFKVLNTWDVAYVDGFSGPWHSQTDDFSDTSFMIALGVLRDAQQRVFERTGVRRRIRCFFSEKDPRAYRQMALAVSSFHNPAELFEVQTFHGEFVDAVDQICLFIRTAFPLIFIDPTGWTEYPLKIIAPLFAFQRCEVLVNFMYDHVARFIDHPDPKIGASLDPILGGPGWQARLDPALRKGLAVEKLFRENLKSAGGFEYVVSTKIDKSTADRPHFFIVYGTKNRAGLKAFRQTEYGALRHHAKNRAAAKIRQREAKGGTLEMFAEFEAERKEATIDELVAEQKQLARTSILQLLERRPSIKFIEISDSLMQAYMLREPNVKDICVSLARDGKISNSWGTGGRKPNDDTIITAA